MDSPGDPRADFGEFSSEDTFSPSATVKIRAEDILGDMKAGLRTKGFLAKYGISMLQFEEVLRKLIRGGLLTKEEFKAWKERRSEPPQGDSRGDKGVDALPDSRNQIVTYVIDQPEKNNSWALQLFSTHRDRIKGAQFKVNLHGRKYSFVVEDLVFRGQVDMLASEDGPRCELKTKREEALDFIATHGWAAYLEQRAFQANFDAPASQPRSKARLVLLHCKNETFLAALHTPAPAINLYVGNSLQKIWSRLARTVDTSHLKI
jgi:hypothetical protein